MSDRQPPNDPSNDTHALRRQCLADALARADMQILGIHEMPYRDRTTAVKGMSQITFDVLYNGEGLVTGIEPEHYQGGIDLALAALHAIAQLPAGIVHPRLRTQSQPIGTRIESQSQILRDAGLEVTGIQLAQFETIFSLQTQSGSATVAIRYNRRGHTTWHEVRSETGEGVGERALRALGLIA